MSVIEDHIRAVVRDELAKAGQAPASAPTAEPAKRGRGRPVKGEDAPATAVQPAPAVVEQAPPQPDPFAEAPDPFAEAPAAPAVPPATEAEVRAALTALRDATSQENAVAVLKAAGGVTTISGPTGLKPEKYGAVVAAAKAAMPALKPVVEADPFAETAPAKTYTLEDVKAAVLEATKRAGADRAAKVVMDLGGKAAKPEGGFGPSWTALPKEQYGAAIEALNALPKTK